MLKLRIILLFLFCVSVCDAQKEGNIWYFGNRAGLNFNGKEAVALTDGVLSTSEGCAVISALQASCFFIQMV